MSEDREEGSSPAGEPNHVIAVTREDNGELAEDVVPADKTKASGSGRGPGTEREVADRVVDTSPAPVAEGRGQPDDPVPGTLPQP
jgi:hypothetical protein